MQKGKNAVQLDTNFYCEDMKGTGGPGAAGRFTRRGVEPATGVPAWSLHHLERAVSCFAAGTH